MSDEAGIRWTIAAYPQLVDDGRFDDVAKLYAPDGIHVSQQRTYEGREAIRTFLSSLPLAGLRHLNGNPVIEVDGTTAVATTDWIAFDASSNAPLFREGGRYTDRLVREGGRWLFAERRNVRWAER